MAGIEEYGGSCPICGSNMHQKWESSSYGYQFDACSWCGYISTSKDVQMKNKLSVLLDSYWTWKDLLERFGGKDFDECNKKYDFRRDSTSEEDSEFYPSIYVAEDKDIQLVKGLMKDWDYTNVVQGKNQDLLLRAIIEGIEIGDNVIIHPTPEMLGRPITGREMDIICDGSYSGEIINIDKKGNVTIKTFFDEIININAIQDSVIPFDPTPNKAYFEKLREAKSHIINDTYPTESIYKPMVTEENEELSKWVIVGHKVANECTIYEGIHDGNFKFEYHLSEGDMKNSNGGTCFNLDEMPDFNKKAKANLISKVEDYAIAHNLIFSIPF